MEKYTAPEMDIILFDGMDVVTASWPANSQSDIVLPEIPILKTH